MASNGGPASDPNGGWSYNVPLDLLAALSLIGLLFVSASGSTVLAVVVRAITGLLLVVLVPGHFFIGALFPRRSTGELTGLTVAERLGLAVGSSLAIGVLLSIALAWSTLPFETMTVLTLFGGVALGLAVVSTIRRLGVPPQHRTGTSVGHVLDHALGRRGKQGVGAVLVPESGLAITRTDRVLNLVIIVVLLAVIGLGVQSVGGEDGTETTELYLLSGESVEDAVAANYSTVAEEPTNRSLYVNVENHEGRRTQYTLVVTRYRSGSPADGAGDVLDRRGLAVADDERVTVPYDGGIAGEGQWLTVSLYRGEETEGEPYRQVQLNLDETEG